MLNFMQKFGLITFTFLVLFLSLSAVSSANFTNSSTTEQIQKFIYEGDDTDLVLDGEFNNLSTLQINRSMKISGKNNAIITKNSSDSTRKVLFNITVVNVTIENLVIRGYDKPIVSNKGGLIIQNNDIKSSNTPIEISNDGDLKDIIVRNNKIATNSSESLGVYLGSVSGNVFDNSVYNNIIAINYGQDGIYLDSVDGVVADNIIYDNTITINDGYHGVNLFSKNASVINNRIYNNIINIIEGMYGVNLESWYDIVTNNNIYNNNINIIEGGCGIGLYTEYDLASNNNIYYNTINTNSSRSLGIYLDARFGMIDNKIYNNTINANESSVYGIFLESWGSANVTNNSIYDNIINSEGYDSIGIYLGTQLGVLANNIYGNIININGSGSYGVLFGPTTDSSSGNISSYNNIICNNTINITGESISGVSLSFWNFNINNMGNVICNNTIIINGFEGSEIGNFGVILGSSMGNMSNNTIVGNNILVNNGTGIFVIGATISDLIVSYNRILADGAFINLTTFNSSNLFFANWLGNNTPDINKIINITMESFYVVNATAIRTTSFVGETWLIDYTFYLNGTNQQGEYLKLPLFMSQLFDESSKMIDDRVAYETGMWDVLIKNNTIEKLKLVLDYETIDLGTFTSFKKETELTLGTEGDSIIGNTIELIAKLTAGGSGVAGEEVIFKLGDKMIGTNITNSEGIAILGFTIPAAGLYTFSAEYAESEAYLPSFSNEIDIFVEEIIPSPQPIYPSPSPNPSPDPTLNSDNKTANTISNNSVASATMKETGMPIIAILLVLLTSLGLLVRKR